MSSTELLEAASISITSSEDALAIATHDSQTPHGSSVGPFTQFSEAARILALDPGQRLAEHLGDLRHGELGAEPQRRRLRWSWTGSSSVRATGSRVHHGGASG